MADALISVVLERLTCYVQNEVTLAIDTHEEVVKLSGNMKQLQAVIADADEKQVKNRAVRIWLDDFKQVVYCADDVLDEWRTKDAIFHLKNGVVAGTHRKVLSYVLFPCFCFKHVIVRYDIGQQIKVINKRLDVITKQANDFGLKVVEVHQNYNEPRRLTSSIVDVSKIHGRDQAKEDIISRLLAESSSRGTSLHVISIVGIGGLGKTTLAKLIFNEERVVEIFKRRMWACVSEPFNLVGVAKAIIKEAEGVVPDSAEWQEVHKCLCQSTKGKRFLLVLDDVWTEDPNHWNQLKLALEGGAPGSRIIVTTRNRTVAKIMGSIDTDIHELEKLSVDDSWLVLRDVAMVGRKNELEKFERIGRKLAIKCKGVPLAITTLASLLCERQSKEEWKDVLGSDFWEFPQIEQFLLPSLFLSYYSLPSISKRCFMYCAIFPKDAKMKKDLLIKLWMAQGFFGYEERSDLDRIGEGHFRILAMRSFFQDFKKDSDGNITYCKMHDLIHDFAMYLSQNECSYLKADDTVSDYDKIHHISANDLKISSVLKAKNLRTLLLRGESTVVPRELFDKLRCLRTLDLDYRALEVLPNEVEELVHLRYLNLSCLKLLELPKTICNLYNLQYLGLNWCTKLHKLPEKIGKLYNLRHLEIEETHALNYFPKTFAALSSLRTLCKFIVGDVGRGCTIGDLQLLNNLQGALELNGLSRVTDEKEAVRAELSMKRHLRELTFLFDEESNVTVRKKHILEKLEPHEDLEILYIRNYPDIQFPGWVQSCSMLTNIIKMSLYKCNHCTELPSFGKLPFLKTLVIDGMGSVTRIGCEFYGFDGQMTAFPQLCILVIKDMEKLEEWELPISNDVKIMPLLVDAKLRNFPVLRSLPGLGSLESLERLHMKNLSSVMRIGNEFYGFCFGRSSTAQVIAFPKLKFLGMEDMEKLEEWEVPMSKEIEMMPLLNDIQLQVCPMLRAIPCLGSLESLERLSISRLSSVMQIGNELYGIDVENSMGVDMIAFPKLRFLEMEDMEKLEEWEVPISMDKKMMPLLHDIQVQKCPMLRALPCLGSLKLLERLNMRDLSSVEFIGNAFYGFDADNSSGDEMIAFPKLKTLVVKEFDKLEEWEIPISKDRKILPFLSKLRLSKCLKLRALPCVWKIKSLEELELEYLDSVERVGLEFVGRVDDNEGSLQNGVIFPKLRELGISHMDSLVEWSIPFITQCLTELRLSRFPLLKTLPTFRVCMNTLESLLVENMDSWEGQKKILIHNKEGCRGGGGNSCLRSMEIGSCPKLQLVPDYMFSASLKELRLSGDVGNLYNSFPTDNTLCSLTKVTIRYLPHSWLPKGFSKLKTLQSAVFNFCRRLDFDLKELQHFTMLQYLDIYGCPILEERLRGDDWRAILAHVPTIYVDDVTKK